MKHTVLLCAGLLVCLIFPTQEIEAKDPMAVGDKFPGIYLKDIDGNEFFLQDHLGENSETGNKALIFSLSASYCKPCIKEIPELDKLFDKYRDKGLGIYIIALQKEDLARDLIAATQTKLPVLIDKYLVVQKLIGNRGIPYTVLIDNEGIVKVINTGFSEKNAQQMVGRLEDALNTVLGLDPVTTPE